MSAESGEPSFSGRLVSVVLFVLVPPLAIALLGLGLGYVRLMHGPVTVKPLAGLIERSISRELPGLAFRIRGGVEVALAERGIEFRLRDVQIAEGDGDVVASAPMAVAALSLPALRSLRLAAERIELWQPMLSLTFSDDGRLALSFKHTAAPGDPAATTGDDPDANRTGPAASGPTSQVVTASSSGATHRLDVARVLTEATARARKRLDAVSYLKEVGIRDATVLFEHGGQRSQWEVPTFSVDLDHRKRRSVVLGQATVQSARGPWRLSFRTEDSEPTHTLQVTLAVRDLVPAVIGERDGGLGLLQMFNVPIGSDAQIRLSHSGELLGGTVKMEIGSGHVFLPGLPAAPLAVDAGLLSLNYDPQARRLELEPSTLVSGESRVTFVGEAHDDSLQGAEPSWSFDLRSTQGTLALDDPAAGSVAIDSWVANGRLEPRRGRLSIGTVELKAGGAQVAVSGEVDGGGGRPGANIEGRISPMPLNTLKAVWPKAIAPATRKWVSSQVTRAAIDGGTFRFVSGAYLSALPGAVPGGREQLSLAIESSNVSFLPAPGLKPIEAPRVLTRIDNGQVEVAAPEAYVVVGANRRLPLKSLRLGGSDLDKPGNAAEIGVRIQSPLGPVLEALDQQTLDRLKQAGVSFDGADGKVEGQVKLITPLGDRFDAAAVRTEGKLKVADGRLRKIGGNLDVSGLAIAFDFSDKAIDASGEMLVNGVPAKLTWQRIFDAPQDKQPPFRITALLDGSDRTQLGLDVNHMVQGDVPAELTVFQGPQGEPIVRFRADLTNADLTFDTIAWKKPTGRSAFLQCDVAKGKAARYELQNLRIAGDDIAIEGSAGIGSDNRLSEFHFPSFSLNVVTRLDVKGRLRQDNVWEIKAKGPTYDGRDFFRALFNVGAIAAKPLKPRAGTDLEAEIDTVIGFSEVSLRALKIKLSKRGEKLTALKVDGKLDGGQPLVAELRQDAGGPRKLLADTTDAGQAFKLTGFYPNIVGGRARLEVNVDGRGPAEKTGVLWVDRFRILGDAVLSEVVGQADTSRPAISSHSGRRQVVREEFEIDAMKLPFAVGHGQFVLEDSYLSGPLLGLYLRGKADFNSRELNLGGTYIPLQGLNNVFGGIPVLRELLSGPRGEGIFGITFAVQGPMAQPQVNVNPLSPLTPGILRGLMEMANPDTNVQAPAQKKPTAPVEKRVRASSAPATRGATKGNSGQTGGETLDGWSSKSAPARGNGADP